MSPDSKWLVTASRDVNSRVFQIWDVASQQVVKTMVSPGGYANVCFSPDGLQLVTATNRGYRIWKVGSWESVGQLDIQYGLRCPIAFSPLGKMAMAVSSRFQAQLVDTQTWKQIAKLETEDLWAVSCLGVSAQGEVLLGTHLWDLHRGNSVLQELGLPSPVPADRLPPKPSRRSDPLRVELDLGKQWAQLGQIAQLLSDSDSATFDGDDSRAIRLLQQVLAIDENHARACNSLAWLMATGAEEFRDPDRAVELSSRSVDREPGNSAYLNTLGVSLYRAGDLKRCIESLESAIRCNREQNGTAYDFIFLALAYGKLGNSSKAEQYLQRADAWCEGERASVRAELRQEFNQARGESTADEELTRPIGPPGK